MSLGERITVLRKNKGMSQEMLAEYSRVSLRTVQRIESGTTFPRPYTLGTIAAALSVSVEDLRANSSQTETDLHPLKMINLTSLLVIIIPVLHILVAVLVWRHFNINQPVHPAVKRIISFQIFWIIATPILALLVHFIQRATIESVAIGQLPPTIVIVYVLMLLINIGLIIRTAVQLQRSQAEVYSSIPALF